ncbi:hypothetical protein D3C73_1254120 [compost metagenome]
MVRAEGECQFNQKPDSEKGATEPFSGKVNHIVNHGLDGLCSSLELTFDVRHFCFNRLNGERLYRTGFARPCADGLQQGIEVRLPSFERVRPTGAVLYRLFHCVRP